MGKTKAFSPVKLICGIIANRSDIFSVSESKLKKIFGNVDLKSEFFPFDYTDYYAKQMGYDLKRVFLSFHELVQPEELASIKIKTNRLEEKIKMKADIETRAVNLDPGYLTASALIMATVKDFSHRIPLRDGIYAHLEILFGKDEIRILPWTYPDYKKHDYHSFFLKVRKIYLQQIKDLRNG
jgi:hypothetical protein